MGKTYKRVPRSYYRRPRGWKQAMIEGVRYGAIPPNAWEDIRHDDQCHLPAEIAETMIADGAPDWKVLRTLEKKFRVPKYRAVRILAFAKWANDATPRWQFLGDLPDYM